MKRLFLSPLLALLLVLPGFGAEYMPAADEKATAQPAPSATLTVPKEVSGDVASFIRIDATTTGKTVRWMALDKGLTVFPAELLKDSKSTVVSASTAGTYRVLAWTAVGDVPSDVAVCTVKVGAAPDPDPTPTPTPTPTPIPVDGFRVLIVYETADVSKLPASQANILYAKDIRDYLNSKCIVGADGKTKEFRIWDQNLDVSGDSKLWQDAMKRTKQKISEWKPPAKPPRAAIPSDFKVLDSTSAIPWILISTGKAGYEGPLPATVEDTLKLLKQYGG